MVQAVKSASNTQTAEILCMARIFQIPHLEYIGAIAAYVFSKTYY